MPAPRAEASQLPHHGRGLYARRMSAASSGEPADLTALAPRRGYLLALMVLIGALILVFVTWRVARERA